VVLQIILYRCETRYLTLRRGQRLGIARQCFV